MGLRNFLFGWASLGIAPSDLVLEVGSGNRPLARSNVLCDLGAFGTQAQYGGSVPIHTVQDRPFVYADAARLPFRDMAFDFIYSAHMLEHLVDPAAFLDEARRVARRGCIITPSPLFECMFAEQTHLWYVSNEGGRLTLRAKAGDDEGPFGRVLQGVWGQCRHLRQFVLGRRDLFETRYEFVGEGLRYRILGQPTPATEATADPQTDPGLRRRVTAGLRSALGAAVRGLLGNRKIRLDDLLACVECGGDLNRAANGYRCTACGAGFALAADGAPILMQRSHAASLPPVSHHLVD